MRLKSLALDDEILSLFHEGFDRAGNSLSRALNYLPPAFAGQIRILLRARQREFPADDFFGEDEPGIIVAGRHDVLERAQCVEARIERDWESLAARVEAERGRSGQDTDAVVGPDRPSS
jgi:hypothetical protein